MDPGPGRAERPGPASSLLFVWPDLHVGLLVWILVAVVVWLVLEKPADGRRRPDVS